MIIIVIADFRLYIYINCLIFQLPISTSSTFTPIPLVDQSSLDQFPTDSDPPLDYLHYSMDSLVQRLVPSDTYIPKVFLE
jgi:hypothetical protein